MGQFEQLDQLLETQDGMLRTAQVVSAGISKPVFYDYVHSRELERVAHGIYLSKDAWSMPCTYFICGSNRQCFPMRQLYFFTI